MKYCHAAFAGTLAVVCLTLIGTDLASAAAERSKTVWDTGSTRNEACRAAEIKVLSQASTYSYDVTKQEACRCTAERRDLGAFVEEKWTCEVKFSYIDGMERFNEEMDQTMERIERIR